VDKRILLSTCIIGLLSQGLAVAETVINPGEVLENSDFFYNPDLIDNQGTLNNSGHIINQNYSALNNSGLTNNSEFGNIRFESNSVLNNSGGFSNYGNVEITQDVNIYNSGVYNNLGGTYQQYGGPFVFENTNILNNSGSLHSSSGFSQLNNNGAIVNTGYITGFQSINSFGTIDNYGEIENRIWSEFNIGASGVLNNGLANMPPIPSVPYGPFMSVFKVEGIVNNAGTINNGYSGDPQSETQIGRGGVINNSGVINNNSKIIGGNQSSSPENWGTINNSGTLINNGDGDPATSYLNGKIVVDTIINTGEIINDGEISVNNIVIEAGVLAGTGTVVIDGDSAYGYGFGTLVITENGTLAPRGPQFDYMGNQINDVTGQMDIYGNVVLDGSLEIDVDLAMHHHNEGFVDSLFISGDLILGSSSLLDINFTGIGSYLFGNPVDLITARSITGDFSNNNYFHDGNWYGWQVIDGVYEDTLSFGITTVPVPAAFWLFGSGLFGLAAFSKRRKS